MKAPRQLAVNEIMVLITINDFQMGEVAKYPALKEGQNIQRKSVPMIEKVQLTQLVLGFLIFLPYWVLEMKKLTTSPKQAPKAWMVVLPPASNSFNWLYTISQLRVQPNTPIIAVTRSYNGPTFPMIAPKDINIDATQYEAVQKLFQLIVKLYLDPSDLNIMCQNLVKRMQICTTTAFTKNVQERALKVQPFMKVMRNPNPISIITLMSWYIGQWYWLISSVVITQTLTKIPQKMQTITYTTANRIANFLLWSLDVQEIILLYLFITILLTLNCQIQSLKFITVFGYSRKLLKCQIPQVSPTELGSAKIIHKFVDRQKSSYYNNLLLYAPYIFLMIQIMNKPLISIAPMIDVSTTHFRYFMRLLTKQATIYTQMLHYNQVLSFHQGELPFHASEHPIVLQLGGSQPDKLADAAEIGARYGYDQINLNVGCPSPRVQSGSFGACLMKQPVLVYECVKSIKERIKYMPCTVKCRLGVDDYDSYQFAKNFVGQVSKNGYVDHFIIHARKAFLKGLNPAQNRSVPPLWYDRVYRLAKDFPHLKFTINGGIKSIQQAKSILTEHNYLQGCMLGRAATGSPYEFVKVDSMIYGKNIDKPLPSRQQILLKYADYLDNVQNLGYFNQRPELQQQKLDEKLGINIYEIKHHKVNPSVLVKPIINMYCGVKNSSAYRQLLSDPKKIKSQPLSDVIKEAIKLMQGQSKQEQDNSQIIQKPIENLQI